MRRSKWSFAMLLCDKRRKKLNDDPVDKGRRSKCVEIEIDMLFYYIHILTYDEHT